MTRRTFNRRAAAAAGMLLAGAAGLSAANAQEATGQPSTPAKPDQPVAPQPVAPKTPGLDEAVALALLTAPSLPAGDHKELVNQVKGTLDLVRDLRKHHVADGAEPDFVFRALLPAKPTERKARRGR